MSEKSFETPYLDADDWEIALAPYEGNAGAALSFGFRLMVLKKYLRADPHKVQEAIAALDLAVEVLFRHTQIHDLSLELFRKIIEGDLTFEEDQKLRAMGIEF